MLGLIVVGLVWGITNYLLDPTHKAGPAFLPDWVRNIMHWRFALPFLANQLGSLLFYWQLGRTPLRLAVPLTNSLAFIVPLLLDWRRAGRRTYMGAALVLAGVVLCLES